MKATPLLIQWHNGQTPIYSAHFQPHGKCRLATGGGDNNVRLWKLEASAEDRVPVYLSTLSKHTQAVNVVRWCPTKEDILASAGDDGNVLLWVPAERHDATPAFGSDLPENTETWRVRHMCRSMGAEIYDLAWSPDGMFFITGSMDNIVRIYNAHDGSMVRQIAEHNHYVQGVAWDPLNEYIATQSSDRSVHIYSLKTKDGHFSLTQFNRMSRMDVPARSSGTSYSPTPPDYSKRGSDRETSVAVSPTLSTTPGTPTSHPVNVNLGVGSYSYSMGGHSRRSSHSSSRRSVSPAPSFPLPAVMTSLSPGLNPSLIRNAHIYANETFTSFFRRLAFSPDGSLLFTPAGQYKLAHSHSDPTRPTDEVLNTVYIYTRAGLNRPPIAYLPGHKKASIAVKCSPVLYELRQATASIRTKNITIDTSSADDIPPLPDSALFSKASTPLGFDDARTPNAPLSPQSVSVESSTGSGPDQITPALPAAAATTVAASTTSHTPVPVFSLPYRMVYAVAAHDTVYVYDTQQRKPICVVSNLHYSAFTDLAWSPDGSTLLISSSDGFCSTLSFGPDELGIQYTGPIPNHSRPSIAPTSSLLPLPGPPANLQPSITSLFPTSSRMNTPAAMSSASVSSRHSRPSTPATSVSTTSPKGKDSRDTAPVSPSTSVAASTTESCGQPPAWVSHHQVGYGIGSAVIPASATPTIGNLPSVTAAQSGSSSIGSMVGQSGGSLVAVPSSTTLFSTTPPMTPHRNGGSVIMPGSRHRTHSASSSISGFNISSLPAPPLFQADSGTATSTTTFTPNMLAPPTATSFHSETSEGATITKAVEASSSKKRGIDGVLSGGSDGGLVTLQPFDAVVKSGEDEEAGPAKKRRITPTLVKEDPLAE